jgi:cob(I)alamin adenosyltransferase
MRTAVVSLNRLSDALFTVTGLINGHEGVPKDHPTY